MAHLVKYKASALMLLTCCFFSTSATAGTQKDIESCRTAITAQGTYDISEHRLRYLSSKGNRNRVLKLEAIPNKTGERIQITCQLNRKSKVVAINDVALVRLAEKQPPK